MTSATAGATSVRLSLISRDMPDARGCSGTVADDSWRLFDGASQPARILTHPPTKFRSVPEHSVRNPPSRSDSRQSRGGGWHGSRSGRRLVRA